MAINDSDRNAEIGDDAVEAFVTAGGNTYGSGDTDAEASSDGGHGLPLSEVTFTPGEILPELEEDEEDVELLDMGPILCCDVVWTPLVGMCTTSQPIEDDELEADGDAPGGGATCVGPTLLVVVRLRGAKCCPPAAPDTAAFQSSGFMPNPLWAARLAPKCRWCSRNSCVGALRCAAAAAAGP